MKTAREIIAGANVEFLPHVPVNPGLKGADAIIAALAAEGFSIVETEVATNSDDVRAAIHDVIPRAYKGEFRAFESIPVEIRGMNVNAFFAAVINASRSTREGKTE